MLRDFRVLLVLKVQLLLLVLKVLLVLMVHREPQVTLEPQVILVLRVLQVELVHRDLLVHKVRQVLLVVRLLNMISALQTTYPALDTLSMGMSGDLESAITEGATIVRIGTDLFGAR